MVIPALFWTPDRLSLLRKNYDRGTKYLVGWFDGKIRDLRRYLRENGLIVQRTKYNHKYLIFCAFSDEHNEKILRFPNVKEIKKL